MPGWESPQIDISPNDFTSRWLAIKPSIERFCMRRLGDAGESEEAVQQVAFHAWSGYLSLRDPARFEAWVFSLAQVEIKKTIRAKIRRREQIVSVEDQEEADPDSTFKNEVESSMPDESWVHAVIGQVTQLGVLTAKEAAVVQHYIDLDERSWEQTGRALGISANDCAASYCRAIPKIRIWILCHHPEVVGGTKALMRAALKARNAGKDALHDFEFEVFKARVLDGDADYHRAGWRTALRSACRKILFSLDLK